MLSNSRLESKHSYISHTVFNTSCPSVSLCTDQPPVRFNHATRVNTHVTRAAPLTAGAQMFLYFTLFTIFILVRLQPRLTFPALDVFYQRRLKLISSQDLKASEAWRGAFDTDSYTAIIFIYMKDSTCCWYFCKLVCDELDETRCSLPAAEAWGENLKAFY